MLDTTITPTDDVVPEKLKEPSKRWKFKLVVTHRAYFSNSRQQGDVLPGDLITSHKIWPSAEIAEQEAYVWLSKGSNSLVTRYVRSFSVAE